MKRIVFILIICFWVGRVLAIDHRIPAVQDSVRLDTVKKSLQAQSLQHLLERDSLPLMTLPVDAQMKMSPVYLPDSLIRDTLRYEYTKIKDFAYKAKWTKELYKMVFVNPHRGYLNVMRTQNSEERFKAYSGKVIHDISIVVLPPYGTSVYDTAYFEEDMGWLKNLANKTHMKTAEKVIRRQLTIKPGMLLVPFELVQNEILLRRLDYIDDANMIVTEDPDNPAQVNVTLICKDQLSWGATVESNFLNSFDIGLENKNFMKLGHVLNYEFSYRGTKDKKWGNELEYKVNSLWGTHINIRGYYRNDYREKEVFVDVERQFLTNRMKWAGGMGVGRVFYSDDLPDRNVNRLEELFNYHYQDVWLGKSFLLPYRYSYNQNMFLTGRFFTTLFNNRPLVTDDTNHLYYNRRDYFAAFTYIKMKYYKANLIYDFGRTEDIPTGLMLSLTTGYEKSEFDNYGYIAGECHYSHFNKYDERYYALEAALGSYVNEDGFTRGTLKLGASHISNLCSWGSFKFRFYNDVHYVKGIRRYPGDFLYMEDRNIRGFSSDTLRGNQKLSSSLATTFFLPYIKKGFRVSISSFCDFGVIAADNKKLVHSKTYWGFGVGVNLRNDNVVIKNISFRFAVYPTIPEDGRSFQAILSSGNRGSFYDYHVTKPQVIQYE
ncbi:MAG TPA: hypothetical protein DHW44_10820 [Odoribacter splanchnicus]|nr:hypothetical protein [Odoribacter splanchnicus]HCL19432.1 hypothetical protein [Odoribacter splanchnicus]HCU27443.1 hypothetical protein [Odoribacter splanchnicus]